MLEIFGIFVLCLLVITAVAIVRTPDLFTAVMLTGIFSLLMATTFFLLDAVDVALTEAAVGAGIATVLLLAALALTAERERPDPDARRRIPLLAVASTGVVIVYATLQKPRLGDPDAPVQQHLGAFYLEQTEAQFEIPNVVTAVLGSFRGYDTFGETLVVFTAALGVLFLLARIREPRDPAFGTPTGLRHHLIPQVVGRAVIPFVVLFGLYVQFHGEYGPGGGFQAGAIVAAGIILFSLLEGEKSARRVLPPFVLLGLMSAGVLIYGGVGLVCLFLGGNFLDYSVLATDPVAGRQLGLLLIELGVGVTVVGVLLSIFHAFASREV